ncbi:hypothetical protein EAI_12109 [Harpegnathos saltator]|uniref:Uncharacterized protein n=1 Tax=Harpegnathos saltator TaxID=610380 RepID=E2BYZ2_HARSA|nr:hypothetical protein EAI_12109 [Harpegnathos saltator]
MGRAKMMVLISMDNLKRMQQQAHTSSTSALSSLSSFSTAILSVLTNNAATGLNIASVENENNGAYSGFRPIASRRQDA